MAAAYDRGTRFTNYSSIHSADAFVGDYQVMYTPGTSPPPAPANRKSSRFTRPSGSIRSHTVTQSYALPPNIPNTSQIISDNAGVLPNVHSRYSIPADEKQIVASLRAVQNELNDAMQTIRELTLERDQAIVQLRAMKAASRRPAIQPKKEHHAPRVEDDLFDMSRIGESPRNSPVRQPGKKVSIAHRDTSPDPASQRAQILSRGLEADQVRDSKEIHGSSKAQGYKRPVAECVDQSIVGEDQTAASNMSRRRRHHALDENMTSAYILPDITVAQPATKNAHVSKAAQHVLQEHDPQHLDNCEVCRRLVTKPKAAQDLTAQISELMPVTNLEDRTIRPKISPAEALANVKRLTTSQFEYAKQKHDQAWKKYAAIPAPLSSKKHDNVSREMMFWQERMEELRLALDNLRDVEEGVEENGDL